MVEENLVKSIINDLIARYSDNIIAIYGIGSYFDDSLPENWERNDLDMVIIVKSLDKILKKDWTDVRFEKKEVHRHQIWLGFNTLEAYKDKKSFSKESFSNYYWSLMELKHPENSKLLHGRDIRDQLPIISNLRYKFDYNDILARGLYHLDKSLSEKDPRQKRKEFSKSVFKVAFYLYIYFFNDPPYTTIFRIGEGLQQLYQADVYTVKQFMPFFQEAIIYRTSGEYTRKFRNIRREFITFTLSILEVGTLHRQMDFNEIIQYFTKSFGGFPYLIHYVREKRPRIREKTDYIISDLQPNMRVNLYGVVKGEIKEKNYKYRDGTLKIQLQFLLGDSSGIVRILVWNEEISKRLIKTEEFEVGSLVSIKFGFTSTGKDEILEVNVGNTGDVVILEGYSEKNDLDRLEALEMNQTISNRLCLKCGFLCPSNVKKCSKCGELLTIN